MSVAIKIQISDPPTPEVLHRFKNFTEEIFILLKETCSVSLEEADLATNIYFVRNIRRRDLGFVTQTIKRQLKRHHFDQTATLERV